MGSRVRALILLLFVAVCFRNAPAQVTSAGSISGEVVDASGALVPGASVIAVQLQTNGQWKSSTGDAGTYIFPNLPVGTFTLTAQKEGFSKQQVNSIILNAGDQQRHDFILAAGAVSDTIEVRDRKSVV